MRQRYFGRRVKLNFLVNEAPYGDICTTHTFGDRVDTVRQTASAGLSACSGLIAGLGESDADLVGLARWLSQ